MFEVELYEDERGSSPAYDFVMSLENRKLQAKEDTQDPPQERSHLQSGDV